MKPRPVSMIPLLAAVGLLLGAGAAVMWAPGCPVREWTGLKCPGCGTGRFITALAGGNVRGAFYWNALLLPLIALLTVAGFRRPWSWQGWLLLSGGILAFGVARNLPFYLLY